MEKQTFSDIKLEEQCYERLGCFIKVTEEIISEIEMKRKLIEHADRLWVLSTKINILNRLVIMKTIVICLHIVKSFSFKLCNI